MIFRIVPSGRKDDLGFRLERARLPEEPDFLAPWIAIGAYRTREQAESAQDRYTPPPPIRGTT